MEGWSGCGVMGMCMVDGGCDGCIVIWENATAFGARENSRFWDLGTETGEIWGIGMTSGGRRNQGPMAAKSHILGVVEECI